jgi:acetylornithine deacetylase
VRPFLCLIGEPTNMQFVLGHKGKGSYRTYCRGLEAHSSLAPRSVNAIHVACDFIAALRESQRQLQEQGARDADYDVPYTTVHVGQIGGGRALNIVPNLCTVDFEVRNLPADDLEQILAQMQERAEVIVREAKKLSSVAAIEIETVNVYPGLDTHPSVEAVRFLKNFAAPDTATSKVSFGTEGGLFKQRLDVPVVVCGPGSIEQAHKPDEFIEISQMEAGERFLGGVLGSLKR